MKRWAIMFLTAALGVLALQSVAGATWIIGYQPDVPEALR